MKPPWYGWKMVRAIAKAASPIDETRIRITYPGQGQEAACLDSPTCVLSIRDHSIRAEYPQITFSVGLDDESTLRGILPLLQSCYTDLMRDYPRAALRNIRSAMLLVAEKAGIYGETVITGEGLDV